MSAEGSRIRRRARPTWGQRVRAVAPPVVAGLLLLAAIVMPDGSDDPRPPGQVSVSRSQYACPGGPDVSIAAGQVAAGTSATGRLLPDRAPVDELADASRWRRADVSADGVLVDQRGRGSGAAGFFTAVVPKSAGGGLVVGSCPPTVEDSWFLGAGSVAKHRTSLVLTNMSSSPVVADLSFWGAQGRIDALDAQGVVVDPFTVRRVDLRELAGGEAELAVRVVRRRGSLAVTALDTSTSVFGGTESLQPTRAPRREQVVAGIPGGAKGRTLILLNPTSSTARVAVTVIGAKGRIAPKGLASVKLDPGELRAVEVPTSAGADRSAFRLRSDQPVSASVRVAPNVKDQAVMESAPALDGAAIVPIDLGGGLAAPELVLTAPGRKATVRLAAFDARMRRLAEAEVSIDPGTTKGVDLASRKVLDAKGVAYVLVRAEGDVVGAATYRRRQGIASLGLTAAPVTVLGPQVRTVG